MGCVVWLVCCGSMIASATPLAVADNRRLGTNIEDTAFVDRGKYAGKLLVLDGDELRVMNPHKHEPPTVACNLHDAGIITHTPRGLAFVAETNELVVHDQNVIPNQLIFFRQNCTRSRSVTIQYGDPAANYVEGLDYIPRTSAFHPGSLALAVNGGPDGALMYIAIIALDGTVIDRVVPTDNLATVFDSFTGMAYVHGGGPDRFVVSLSSEVWTIAVDGSASGPFVLPVPSEAEGIEQDGGGDLIFTSYSGAYIETSKKLVARPATARDIGHGPFTGRIRSIDHAHGAFLFSIGASLSSLTDDYGTATLLGNQPYGGRSDIAALGASQLIAVTRRATSSLYLFDEVGSAFDGGHPLDLTSQPGAITYADSIDTFFVTDVSGGTLVHRFTSSYVDLGDLDLSGLTGVTNIASVSWHATATGDGELFVLADGQVIRTTLAGVELDRRTVPANITLQRVTAINDGRYANQLFALDTLDTNRVFRFVY